MESPAGPKDMTPDQMKEIMSVSHINAKWAAAAAKFPGLASPSHPIWVGLYRRHCDALEAARTRLEQTVKLHPAIPGKLGADDYIQYAKADLEPARGPDGTFIRWAEPKQEDKLRCKPDDIVNGVLRLSASMLPVSRAEGTAFLIAVKDTSTPVEKVAIQPTPGVRGYDRTLGRSGQMQSINAWVVYEQDQFTYVEGGDRDPEIVRPRMGYDRTKPNRITHGVGRILLKDGRKCVCVLDLTDESIRTRIASQNAWLTAEENVKKAARLEVHREVLYTYLHDNPALESLAVLAQETTKGDREPTVIAPILNTCDEGAKKVPELVSNERQVIDASPTMKETVRDGTASTEVPVQKSEPAKAAVSVPPPSAAAMDQARQRMNSLRLRAEQEVAPKPAPAPEAKDEASNPVPPVAPSSGVSRFLTGRR